jgi:hypothetical protein
MIKNYQIKKLNTENLKGILKREFDGDYSIKENLNKEALIEMGLTDCIIYNYDSVISDEIKEVDIDYENIIEARFFNEKMEIRVFNDEGVLSGTIFVDENPDYIESEFILYSRDKNSKRYAEKLKVRKYIGYDEDGQAYISYVRPCKLIF